MQIFSFSQYFDFDEESDFHEKIYRIKSELDELADSFEILYELTESKYEELNL